MMRMIGAERSSYRTGRTRRDSVRWIIGTGPNDGTAYTGAPLLDHTIEALRNRYVSLDISIHSDHVDLHHSLAFLMLDGSSRTFEEVPLLNK